MSMTEPYEHQQDGVVQALEPVLDPGGKNLEVVAPAVSPLSMRLWRLALPGLSVMAIITSIEAINKNNQLEDAKVQLQEARLGKAKLEREFMQRSCDDALRASKMTVAMVPSLKPESRCREIDILLKDFEADVMKQCEPSQDEITHTVIGFRHDQLKNLKDQCNK